MDIHRSDLKQRSQRRRASLWLDTVKCGDMLREGVGRARRYSW